VSKNFVTNSTVIPGKLAKLARPGIQEFLRHLDGNETMTYSTDFPEPGHWFLHRVTAQLVFPRSQLD